MSRRVLKGCIATLAPAPVASSFAAANELSELQAAAQEHNGQLLEGLRAMCALVLQPAKDVEVRGWFMAGRWERGQGGSCFVESCECVEQWGNVTDPQHAASSGVPDHSSQDARSKLQHLYRQLRVLDVETQAGLTGACGLGRRLAGRTMLGRGSLGGGSVGRWLDRVATHQSEVARVLTRCHRSSLPAAAADLLLLYASTQRWLTCGEC